MGQAPIPCCPEAYASGTYDLTKGECLREITLEEYGMSGIFSIFNAISIAPDSGHNAEVS
jgi:hypothetical protein